MFKSAKIKLTAWYLLIIMTVSLVFSSVVYVGVGAITLKALTSQSIRIENEFKECVIIQQPKRFINKYDVQTLSEIQERTLNTLVWINFAILLISGALGYFLAGETLKPIEEMVQKQKRFVSDAAHELKTPLTAIKTDFEVTLRDKNSKTDDFKNSLTSALEEVNSLSVLTEKLLKQSKYTYEEKPTNTEIFSVKELLSEIYDKHDANRIFILSFPDEDVKAKGNRLEIKEALNNLIENALKYTPRDKKVEIKLEKLGREALIKVMDEGRGISKEALSRIFEPFYREDDSRTDSIKNGYGLGLTIAKDVIEKHGGKITVKSEIGLGTTFTVNLPTV